MSVKSVLKFADEEKARSALKLAKQTLDRLMVLERTSAVAVKEREQAQSDHAQAQAELEAFTRGRDEKGTWDSSERLLARVLPLQELLVAGARKPLLIFAAAVADWRVASEGAQKIKKTGAGMPPLQLVENPDILATIATLRNKRPPLVIGFAAETEHLIDNAKAKIKRKGCDWIVANDVSPATGVMGGDRNTVHLLTRDGRGAAPHERVQDNVAFVRVLLQQVAQEQHGLLRRVGFPVAQAA